MGLEHFRVNLTFDEENQEFIAMVPELETFEPVRAKTRVEVMEALEEALDSAVQNAVAEEGSVPEAIDSDDEKYTGSLTLEIGKALHRELAHKAIEDKIAIEKVALLAIQSYVAHQMPEYTGRGDYDNRNRSRRGSGGRRSYHDIMENKASFLEYVRQQEKATGGANRPNRRRRQKREE